jgi:hypothetical protein
VKQRLAAACLAAVVGLAAAAPVAVAAPILGKTFELAAGDDPVEAFALDGLSVAGASYEIRAADGSRFRVDRAAQGRAGFVVVSRAVEELKGGRARWQVTAAVPVAVDSADAFTSDCRAASGQVSFLFYEPDKSGKAIRKAEQGFKLDLRTGGAERARIAAADCRAGQLAAAPTE